MQNSVLQISISAARSLKGKNRLRRFLWEPQKLQVIVIKEQMMKRNNRTGSGYRFPVNLYCSLLLLGFVPFLYTLVRTNLIADNPSADGLGIAGHIEWFDLINETIQAFLIVPLYALLNQSIKDKDKLKERIFQTFLIVNVIYILFSAFIFVYCSQLVI